MKKIMLLLFLVCFMLMPIGVQAYTVTIFDPPNDQIGSGFETTSITYNSDSYPPDLFMVDIVTQYRLTGLLVGSWQTMPADLFLDGAANGVGWDYAIPLVAHDGFVAGGVYSIGTLAISDEFEPAGGGYIYNHNVPVWLKTGTYQGIGGSWADTAAGIRYAASDWYWNTLNPPGDVLTIGWATATCANDVVVGTGTPTPIPPAILLLGSGLIGLVTVRRRKLQK